MALFVCSFDVEALDQNRNFAESEFQDRRELSTSIFLRVTKLPVNNINNTSYGNLA